MATSEGTQAKNDASTALYQAISAHLENDQSVANVRKLAEAFALVSGTYTGRTKVDVKKS